MLYRSLLATIGLILALAHNPQATPRQPEPSGYYGQQVLAALHGSIVGALIYIWILEEATPEIWCKRWAPSASIPIGVGAATGTELWSEKRHSRGNWYLAWALATIGAFLVTTDLCRHPPAPLLLLTAQILTASLLAPIGYNLLR